MQKNILAALATLKPTKLYTNRDNFVTDLEKLAENFDLNIPTPVFKAILAALSERDPAANICTDADGNPEPDSELRDTESVALPDNIALPLPIDYDRDADNTALVKRVRTHCEAYFAKEVQPHWPDAWIDFSKTKIGYEIPINRHFYVYQAPRPLAEIEQDIKTLEGEILDMLKAVA